MASVCVQVPVAGQDTSRPVYEIRVKDQAEPIYGYVDDWEKSSIKVELDMPWLPEPRIDHISKTKIESHVEEWSGARADRLDAQARKAGYEPIGGRYYSSEEIAWSRESKRRASATADAALVSAPPDPGTAAEPVTAAPPPETSAAVSTETNWVKRWGTQAAVGVAGLLLAAAVAWKLVF